MCLLVIARSLRLLFRRAVAFDRAKVQNGSVSCFDRHRGDQQENISSNESIDGRPYESE
jgi:hypothetical protein